MKSWLMVAILAFSLAYPALLPATTAPSAKKTPGHLCTDQDDDFDDYYYEEEIARCVRHVTKAEKREVAEAYRVEEADWPDYEFDHLIPLCAGGSNDIRNLWPQPIEEALEKDKLEREICDGMKNGTMTQKTAVKKTHEWFKDRGHAPAWSAVEGFAESIR